MLGSVFMDPQNDFSFLILFIHFIHFYSCYASKCHARYRQEIAKYCTVCVDSLNLHLIHKTVKREIIYQIMGTSGLNVVKWKL